MAIPTVPDPKNPSEPSEASSVILEAQLEDLELELRTVRRKKRRHFVWALTGISPAAFLPAVGLVLVESYGLFLILLFLVSFSQFLLGIKASGKEARLERAIDELRTNGGST